MTPDQPAFAHTLPGLTADHWELLSTHLREVADLTAGFAAAFDAAEWGRALGAWHDLGKYSDAFQDYLHKSHAADAGEQDQTLGRIDHSTFGARHAFETARAPVGPLMAFCIAGHHAGLTDATPSDDISQRSTLAYRLDKSRYEIEPVPPPPDRITTPLLKIPLLTLKIDDLGFTLAFFTRMLFSALIDADRTATEAFCDKARSQERLRPRPTLAELREAVDRFLAEKQATAAKTEVNAVRARVLAECVSAAAKAPGFFSLNVPTGGGKTFASLAFALRHAAAHVSLRRVVVAIPFTSIIEQTADQYRAALGPLAALGLIEHHSNLNPQRDTRENQMASENWDAPLIVTTNVQLFESLFAAATTAARKLHRLANSVIILDEAQTLPVDLLRPTLAALKELVERYGCTIVLCTATQPALEYRGVEFEIGLRRVEPIIADAPALHAALKRVAVKHLGRLNDDDLADRLAAHRSALGVVNTKAHAASLFDAIVARRGDADGCFHLSTFMCAQHRRDVLATIRQRLIDSQPCLVISTQLIEAGVDVDFPVVYRAPCGFDSLAQAAGRCNREGNLRNEHGHAVPGHVYAFDTDKPPPPGLLRIAAQVAKALADDHPAPLAPPAVEAYFRSMYWSLRGGNQWDKSGVMECFAFDRRDPGHQKLPPFKFKTAAAAYKLIGDDQTAILVPYNDEAKAMISHLLADGAVDYLFFRRAQRYTVSVYDELLRKVASNAALVPHEAGLWMLANPDAYSPEKGMLANVLGLSASMLMV